MSLPEIQIDDRTYDDLLAVLRKQIPGDYTDHNPSDPLIMLLELLCWLGEMALYRMNRISGEHQGLYLELLADRPVPSVVPVTFSATYGLPGAHEIEIPVGTRVATDFAPYDFDPDDADPPVVRRSVFETIEAATIPDTDPITNSVDVPAREFLEVTDELLGTARGVPHESFGLSPVHSTLGIQVGGPAPVLFDDENRSAEYDPNPQIRTFRGLLTGIGGQVSAANGVLAAHFDGDPVETQFFLTFTPPNLRLTRLDGQFHDAPVAPGPIPVGETEELDFPPFEARVVLSDAFDKTTPISLGTTSVNIVGTGVIDPTSVTVISASGSVEGITTTTMTIPDLTTPNDLNIVLADGFTGTLDGTSTGLRQVVLTDPHGNRLTIALDVQTTFDGAETSASFTFGALENLVVHGGERWVAHHALLTERSRVDPGDPGHPRHVFVRPLARTVHFGDGSFGALPTAGAKVVCSRYQLAVGPPNLIEAGEIVHLLTPIAGLNAGDAVAVGNLDDAAGGEHFFSDGDRVAEALGSFRRPYRLVTADDFERTLLDDFSEYQKLARRSERIARAAAIMNRKPPLLEEEAPGHVTVMVARKLLTQAEQDAWSDLATPLAAKQALLGLPTLDPLDPLRRKIKTFLNERRLITTHVEVIAPTLVGVSVTLSVVVQQNRNTAEMQTAVGGAVMTYLSLLEGGTRGGGWPMGRSVYRSELLRVVEGVEGVDHVQNLTLAPANADGDADIEAHELPVVTLLDVVAVRP